MPGAPATTQQVDLVVDAAPRRSKKNNTRSLSRRRQPDNDALKIGMGIAGSLVLFLAVFAPIIKVPIVGGVDYFRNGEGDGVIVLVLAILSFIFVLCRIFQVLWFTGTGSLLVIGYTFVNFQSEMSKARKELESMSGNPFSGLGRAMVDSVSLDWGFPLLIIGAGLVIAAAATPSTSKSSRPYEKANFVVASLVGGIAILLVVIVLLFTKSDRSSAIPFSPSSNMQEEAYRDIARRQLSTFRSMNEMYKLDTGRYPQRLDDLRINPGIEGWRGPYIKEAIPFDPWEMPYRYESSTPTQYRIWSRGPDGVSGTKDDISVVEPTS